MKIQFVELLVVLLAGTSNCFSVSMYAQESKITQGGPIKGESVQIRLPYLKTEPMIPLPGKEKYFDKGSQFRFDSREQPEIRVPAVSNSEEAIQAARRFVQENFGDLPPETTLKVFRVLQSSIDGRKRYNVGLRQHFQGAYIEESLVDWSRYDDGQCDVRIVLYRPFAVAEPKVTVISRDNAVSRFTRLLKDNDASDDTIKSLLDVCKPQLMYSNVFVRGKNLAPAWGFGPQPAWIMDGETGRIIHND